jgi:hypothetical protein
MKCMDRYNAYSQHGLDEIILYIRRGQIKAGRYAHLIKIDKNKIIKDKELFKNGSGKDESSEKS